jgi:hypothetical protein
VGIGGGITLIVLGLILTMNVIQVDIPAVNENALGMILIIAGIVSLVLFMTVWRSGGPWATRGTTRVVERDTL